MKTVTVQIGNSDDKLTQKEWNAYWTWVDMEIRARASHIYFCGLSPSNTPWQNACWIFDVDWEDDMFAMKKLIKNVSEQYNQESFAWTVGDTELV